MPTHLRQFRHQPFRVLSRLAEYLGDESSGGNEAKRDKWVGLSVRLGSQWLLLPRHEVAEVLRLPKATRVPGGPPWLQGVANVRGGLVTVIDLNAVFGAAPAEDATNARAVVFRHDQHSTAFLVDEVTGFHSFSVDDQRHELQAEAPEALHPFLLGAFVGEGDSWLVFSLSRLSKSSLIMESGSVRANN